MVKDKNSKEREMDPQKPNSSKTNWSKNKMSTQLKMIEHL